MLEAAEDLFAARGYAATTTREIAERARVSEQLLYNHFGSKQQLFESAVVEPFEDFAARYLEEWGQISPAGADPEEMLRVYVEGLYRLTLEHRRLFLALGPERLAEASQAMLDRLETLTVEIAGLHGYGFDAGIAVRTVFASVTTLATHQEALLPGRDTDEVIKELAATIVCGLTRRP